MTDPSSHDPTPDPVQQGAVTPVPDSVVGHVTHGTVRLIDTASDSGDAWITYEPHDDALAALNSR